MMRPTILTPASRFAIAHQHSTPRSPSRSPHRQEYPMSHELDPLLANLSPTSTLEALEATEAIDPEGRASQSLLHDSVAAASTSERALGIRAALAGKKLKKWHAELTAWPWPLASSSPGSGFRVPPQVERSINNSRPNHEGYINKAVTDSGSVYDLDQAEDEEYWGSLPAKLVREYENRIEEIVEDMEALGVEELKDYVRDAHLSSNPRRISRTTQDNPCSRTNYIHLDDFTAVITSTIMQSLPIISRLNALIAPWSIRLSILRQIPDFLELLELSQIIIANAWDAIGNMDGMIETNGLDATNTALHSKRTTLEENIRELGRRLDSMLDLLEGREDTIPEEWIDSMESIEAEFGEWVVETERRLMEEGWKADQKSHDLGAQSQEKKTESVVRDDGELSGSRLAKNISEGARDHDVDSNEDGTEQVRHNHEETPNSDAEIKGPEVDSDDCSRYSEEITSDGHQAHPRKRDAETVNNTREHDPKNKELLKERRRLDDLIENESLEQIDSHPSKAGATNMMPDSNFDGHIRKGKVASDYQNDEEIPDADIPDSYPEMDGENSKELLRVLGFQSNASDYKMEQTNIMIAGIEMKLLEKDFESDSHYSDEKTQEIHQDNQSLQAADHCADKTGWDYEHVKMQQEPSYPESCIGENKPEQTYEAHEQRLIPDLNGEHMAKNLAHSIAHCQFQLISPGPGVPSSSDREDESKERQLRKSGTDAESSNLNRDDGHDDSPSSYFQDELRLPDEALKYTPEADSNPFVNERSFLDLSDQDVDDSAHSVEAEDDADNLYPASNPRGFVAVSIREGPERAFAPTQTAIAQQVDPKPSENYISTDSTLSEDQSNATHDDPVLNEYLENVDIASVRSRVSEQTSIPADNFSVDNSGLRPPKRSRGKRPTKSKPAPLLLRQFNSNSESNAASEISSDSSMPGSGTSEYFSNMSSPEIQHASMAEYFEHPVEVTTPSIYGPSTPLGNFPRRSSFLPERDVAMFEPGSIPTFSLSTTNRRRASSVAPDSSIPESARFLDELPIHRGKENVRSHIRVRSASLKSFEVIPRHEIRNVTIRRSESSSSTIVGRSNSYSEDKSTDGTLQFHTPTLEVAVKSEAKAITLPADDDNQSLLVVPTNGESEVTISARVSPMEKSSLAKSRHRFESVSDLGPGLNPPKVRRQKSARTGTTEFSVKKSLTPPPVPKSLKSSEDQLEARISSILTEIPGHIRLKSGPEPDAPDVLPSSAYLQKKHNSQSPAARLKRPQISMPTSPLTLTPAHSKRSRSSSGEPEIKLYHLHQSGKDVPVKLFVRLVGEGGERVMVRIGGGWADLGEYLKEYASHHGRRTTSDGRFEIQGLPQPQTSTPLSNVAISSPPYSPSSRPATPSMRASSALSMRTSSALSMRTSSALSFRRANHSTSSSADLDAAPPTTPENAALRYFEPTPGSLATNSSLRPSSRSSRFSSTDDDSPLGLAGPKTRRKEVSPSKQAWVDDMLNQARKASAEKKKGGSEGDFVDLGKVGGTKRVLMRTR